MDISKNNLIELLQSNQIQFLATKITSHATRSIFLEGRNCNNLPAVPRADVWDVGRARCDGLVRYIPGFHSECFIARFCKKHKANSLN